MQSYNDVADVQNQYFSQFAGAVSSIKATNVLKKAAIESTLNNLTEAGIEAGVTDGLKQILLHNTQQGSSIADVTDQLRNYLTNNEKGPGAIEQYVGTYATTAINQYSAEYNKSIADDLGLEWYMYVGSLLTTSRPFCQKAVEKKYIHVSEFETLLHGDFGPLGKVHVNKKTGLPDGLMEGTNPENFPRRRGGWNCGHQLVAVADIAAPQNVKDAVYASAAYQNWALRNGKEVKKPSIVANTNANPNVNISQVKNFAQVNEKTFEKLTRPVNVNTNPGNGTYFDPRTNQIHLDPERGYTEDVKKMMTYHEFGHAIHIQNDIITELHVQDQFKKVYDNSKKAMTGKYADVETKLYSEFRKSLYGNPNADTPEQLTYRDKIGVVLDIIGSLTMGRFGGGHSVQYYRSNNAAYMELFAHGNTMHFMQNDVAEEYIPEVVEIVKKYFGELYQQ